MISGSFISPRSNFLYSRSNFYNAVIFASFLTGVVLNTLFSASGYRIAIKICKDCVLENNEAVEKSDNYAKTSRKVVKF